jgi:uncharacterized protein (TIGR03086 family)
MRLRRRDPEFEVQRIDYFGALEWTAALMRGTGPGQLGLATPCEEFTVRDLMGHLIGTALRSAGTARGLPTGHVPHVVADIPDADLATAYEGAARHVREEWRRRGCGDTVTAPWGPCTALEALRGFTVETVTHGWDLAVATGQPRAAPGQIAGRCLAFAGSAIPERLRGVMYDSPATDMNGDDPTTRLAHFLGHRLRS